MSQTETETPNQPNQQILQDNPNQNEESLNPEPPTDGNTKEPAEQLTSGEPKDSSPSNHNPQTVQSQKMSPSTSTGELHNKYTDGKKEDGTQDEQNDTHNTNEKKKRRRKKGKKGSKKSKVKVKSRYLEMSAKEKAIRARKPVKHRLVGLLDGESKFT